MGQQQSRRRQRSSSFFRDRLDSSGHDSGRGLQKSGSVHDNLVRHRGKKVVIEDVYEVVGQIGQGALCVVYKLHKNKDKIGGSSRPELQRKSIFNAIRFLSDNDVVKLEKTESFGPDPLDFALKVINLKMVKEDKIDQLNNEVEILKTMDHMNIIKAYETFQDKVSKKLMIVMELCTGGNLYNRIPYSEQQAANITKQILSAVSYMHKRNVIHRDIKFENILFESNHPDSLIRVIDFGLSKEYDSCHKDVLSERVGTLYSMSPETLKGAYDAKADLWSIGVCSYMLLAEGNKPFDGMDSKGLVKTILKAQYNFDDPVSWESISSSAKAFVDSLLVIDPQKRPSATEACNHEWIRNMVTPEHISDELKSSIQKSLVRYAGFGSFRKIALYVIAKRSTPDEISELRRVFCKFDESNMGTLTRDTFQVALQSFNFSKEEALRLFKALDLNQNNEINFTEFLAACLEAQGRLAEYRLAEAFDFLDSDDTGYISRDNLRKFLKDVEKNVDLLIPDMNLSKSGRIYYKDFLNIFADQVLHKSSDPIHFYSHVAGPVNLQLERNNCETQNSLDQHAIANFPCNDLP